LWYHNLERIFVNQVNNRDGNQSHRERMQRNRHRRLYPLLAATALVIGVPTVATLAGDSDESPAPVTTPISPEEFFAEHGCGVDTERIVIEKNDTLYGYAESLLPDGAQSNKGFTVKDTEDALVGLNNGVEPRQFGEAYTIPTGCVGSPTLLASHEIVP
jgi:hypothetical protein